MALHFNFRETKRVEILDTRLVFVSKIPVKYTNNFRQPINISKWKYSAFVCEFQRLRLSSTVVVKASK